MLAKKCDRCGVLYEEREANALERAFRQIKRNLISNEGDRITEIITAISNLVDFCPDCEKSLAEWLKGGKNEQ